MHRHSALVPFQISQESKNKKSSQAKGKLGHVLLWLWSRAISGIISELLAVTTVTVTETEYHIIVLFSRI